MVVSLSYRPRIHPVIVTQHHHNPGSVRAGRWLQSGQELPYSYWQHIYGRKLYDTEQIQVAEQVIEQIERVMPGIRADIEVTDVATPLSYERYTGNWQGATSGFLLTKQTMRMLLLGVDKTLPGLGNFYMAGQWVEPGGSVPTSAMSGRQAIQLLCHADGRPFERSEA